MGYLRGFEEGSWRHASNRLTNNYRSIRMHWLGPDLELAFEEFEKNFPVKIIASIGVSLVCARSKPSRSESYC